MVFFEERFIENLLCVDMYARLWTYRDECDDSRIQRSNSPVEKLLCYETSSWWFKFVKKQQWWQTIQLNMQGGWGSQWCETSEDICQVVKSRASGTDRKRGVCNGRTVAARYTQKWISSIPEPSIGYREIMSRDVETAHGGQMELFMLCKECRVWVWRKKHFHWARNEHDGTRTGIRTPCISQFIE